MSDYALEATGLTRYFGQRCVVDTFTLRVPRGSVVALLGRNGSGKTTTLRMMLGLIEPTRGSATVLGEDAMRLRASTRARIGYIAETHPLYENMTVGQAGRYHAKFFGRRWDERTFRSVVDHFQLADTAPVSRLSRGERAGMALALTLAPRPELLVLDDPALGLDPVARRLLLEAMVSFTRGCDRTILFSSHLLSDVERVADRVAILDRSVLRVDAPIEAFRAKVRQYLLVFDRPAPPVPDDLPGVLGVRREGNELRVNLANADDHAHAVLERLAPMRMGDSPVTFEDAVIGYLGDRTERALLPVGEVEDKGGAA